MHDKIQNTRFYSRKYVRDIFVSVISHPRKIERKNREKLQKQKFSKWNADSASKISVFMINFIRTFLEIFRKIWNMRDRKNMFEQPKYGEAISICKCI